MIPHWGSVKHRWRNYTRKFTMQFRSGLSCSIYRKRCFPRRQWMSLSVCLELHYMESLSILLSILTTWGSASRHRLLSCSWRLSPMPLLRRTRESRCTSLGSPTDQGRNDARNQDTGWDNAMSSSKPLWWESSASKTKRKIFCRLQSRVL